MNFENSDTVVAQKEFAMAHFEVIFGLYLKYIHFRHVGDKQSITIERFVNFIFDAIVGRVRKLVQCCCIL